VLGMWMVAWNYHYCQSTGSIKLNLQYFQIFYFGRSLGISFSLFLMSDFEIY
jgi:hypothetical protein